MQLSFCIISLVVLLCFLLDVVHAIPRLCKNGFVIQVNNKLECACFEGFFFVTFNTCEKKNICNNNVPCTHYEECRDIGSKKECVCSDNYAKNSLGVCVPKICKDITVQNGRCKTNKKNGPIIVCNDNYKLSGDICVKKTETDPTEKNLLQCNEKKEIVKKREYYSYCECKSGFLRDEMNKCQESNKCLENKIYCRDGTCSTEEDGEPKCVCDVGFAFINGKCEKNLIVIKKNNDNELLSTQNKVTMETQNKNKKVNKSEDSKSKSVDTNRNKEENAAKTTYTENNTEGFSTINLLNMSILIIILLFIYVNAELQ